MIPEQVSNLHRLASAWFEEHGLIEEALQHALAAGDHDLAARQMSAGLRNVLNREDRPTLERWLKLLPEELIQRDPGLLMIRVWVLQFMWRLDLQGKVLQQVENLLDSEVGKSLPAGEMQILRGQALLVRSQQAYFKNQHRLVIDLCQQVLALVPPGWKFVRGGAMLYVGMSMQASGQALEAERLLLAEYETYSEKADIYALFLLQSLCFVYLNSGQLEQARKIAQVMLQGAARGEIAIIKNWSDWFCGIASYQQNELEDAEQQFAQIVKNRYIAQISTYRDAIAGLALIHQSRGKSVEANQLLESISKYDLEYRGREDERTRSLRARLLLMQGDLEGAGQWVDSFTDPPPDQPLFWLEEPQVTRTRILLARGGEINLRLALQILDALEEIVDSTYNTRCKIEILVLRALALDAQGETTTASNVLKQAIDLAQPGGFTRVFIDLGEPVQAMLRRLEKQDLAAETVSRILAAFPADDVNLVNGVSLSIPC